MLNPKEKVYRETDAAYLEELAKDVQKSEFLPSYHIYPKSGLMNDPNGLAYFQGKYEVFFQWYPYDAVHGLKHWGRTTSTDLVHWSQQEMALVPDQTFEKNGCYSGNAIEHDEKLFLFYTANYKTPTGKIAKQALATMTKEGVITKRTAPIIEGAPEGLSQELRDPFVFQREDSFYMLLGGGKFNGPTRNGFGDEGVLLLYRSDNLYDWSYMGLIDLPIDTGYMLECPSLITVENRDVLLLSPMGLEQSAVQFKNRFATIQLVGELDIANLTFKADDADVLEIDSGFDYYAPQAFYGQNQVPMTFAWFGCGEPMYETDKEKWKHGLTMPQQLSIKKNKLYRFPVQDLLTSFTEPKPITTHSLQLTTPFYRLHLEEGFNLNVGTETDYWALEYDKKTTILTVSRANLAIKIDPEYGYTRKVKVKELTAIDLFVDNSFVEVYVNGGERSFSFRTFQKKVTTIQFLEKQVEGSFSLFDG